jgi:HprK-related kinase B
MKAADRSLLATLQQIREQTPLSEHTLQLALGEAPLQIRSNSMALLETLHRYFEGLVNWAITPEALPHAQQIHVYQVVLPAESIQTAHWQDWHREAGKSGRKDAIIDGDLEGRTVRLLHKVKTGMLFLQPAADNAQLAPCAFGPAETQASQVVNFILSQYLNHHLRHQWLLGHASALQIHSKGVAFAGLSGGGKSTLMLHLLAQGEHFISNDRLLIKLDPQDGLRMRGIPKQPRVNPGTLVHNPQLQGLLSPTQRQAFLDLPEETLRTLEQKHDVPVNRLYRPDCYQLEARLDKLIILNWQPTGEFTRLSKVDLTNRRDLLPAIMKSPGPFYATDAQHFLANGTVPQANAYLTLLQHCEVYELYGKIDFDAAQRLLLDLLAK